MVEVNTHWLTALILIPKRVLLHLRHNLTPYLFLKIKYVSAASAFLCKKDLILSRDGVFHVKCLIKYQTKTDSCSKISKCFHLHCVFLKPPVIKAVFKWSRKGHAVTQGCVPPITDQMHNKHSAKKKKKRKSFTS